MPKGTGSLLHLLLPGWREKYELRDEFSSPLAAGSVNGTAAEPGPGTRAVTDTESKLAIASGVLTFAVGTLGITTDPILSEPSQARVLGRMLLGKRIVTTDSASAISGIGFSVASKGQPDAGAATYLHNGSRIILYPNTVIVGTWASSTAYSIAIVLRVSGAFYFIKGGAFTNWSLLYVTLNENTTPLFPTVNAVNAAHTLDNFRVPRRLWLPVPLASDGFPTAFGTTDGTGHAETSGLGAGGNGLAWTQALGTWGISGAAANCSVLGAGSIGVATVTTPTVNVLAAVGVTRAAGGAGLVLRYTDASNFLYAYHDGTNAALIEKVAGVDANVVAPAAATYSAGAVLRVILDGTAARLFYNNAAVGAVGTTNITTGANHGLWTNNTGPTLDNFVVYARGTGGEYAYLDRFIK